MGEQPAQYEDDRRMNSNATKVIHAAAGNVIKKQTNTNVTKCMEMKGGLISLFVERAPK